MSDEGLRELERRWSQTGAPEDARAYQQALRRSGISVPSPLEEAAVSSDGATDAEWLEGLGRKSPRAQVAAVLAVEADEYEPTWFTPDERAAVERAFLVLDRWAHGTAAGAEVERAEQDLAGVESWKVSRLREACRLVAGQAFRPTEALPIRQFRDPAALTELMRGLVVRAANVSRERAHGSVLACAYEPGPLRRRLLAAVVPTALLAGVVVLLAAIPLTALGNLGRAIETHTVTTGKWAHTIASFLCIGSLLLVFACAGVVSAREAVARRRARRRLAAQSAISSWAEP